MHELLFHLARQPADGRVLEPFGNCTQLRFLQSIDRLLLLLQIARVLDLRLDRLQFVAHFRRQVGTGATHGESNLVATAGALEFSPRSKNSGANRRNTGANISTVTSGRFNTCAKVCPISNHAQVTAALACAPGRSCSPISAVTRVFSSNCFIRCKPILLRQVLVPCGIV